jgi:hypothetical protein
LLSHGGAMRLENRSSCRGRRYDEGKLGYAITFAASAAGNGNCNGKK